MIHMCECTFNVFNTYFTDIVGSDGSASEDDIDEAQLLHYGTYSEFLKLFLQF